MAYESKKNRATVRILSSGPAGNTKVDLVFYNNDLLCTKVNDELIFATNKAEIGIMSAYSKLLNAVTEALNSESAEVVQQRVKRNTSQAAS